ncbi:MAG: hypothetical protein P8O79_10775 [Halieaceae bacterium]|nr:hypothetical protein [Halieaceae bacterium]
MMKRLHAVVTLASFSTFLSASLMAHPDPDDKESAAQLDCRPGAIRAEHAKPKRRRPGVEPECRPTYDQVYSGATSQREPVVAETELLEHTQTIVKQTDGDAKEFVARRFSSVPRPSAEQFVAAVPIPDRWRIVDALGYEDNWWDPYNQNTIKGDKPIHDDWFFNITAISDTVYEFRDVPTPVGGQTTDAAGSLDVLGNVQQGFWNQNTAVEFVYYKGDTVFRPPDWEYRFIPVFNYNAVRLGETLGTNADPEVGRLREDNHVGIQTLFVDRHLRNVSDRYDFDSVRVGIQPFSSDFRGFLFQDVPFGVRLFGNRDDNKYQYNLGWFRRLEKDTNSGLNDLSESLRNDDVFVANLYLQDKPSLGFFSQFSLIYNRNREKDKPFYDTNQFIQRPASLGQERLREYDVYYLGYSGDGHFGRINLTTSLYLALGEEQDSVFTSNTSDIEAYFIAAEPSIDFDWIRLRGSFLYGSGDDNPFDGKSQGFDAIFENPQFAGADTSYWIRQGVPLIGGGRVALSQRNGILNSLRSSKEHGQSNFTNPGVVLAGVGADLDILPELRLSLNANYLAFATTEVLEIARAQADIDRHIGYDLSASLIYRPFMTQNVVIRLSYAQLLSGDGYQQLFGNDEPVSVLLNAVLTF